MLLIDILQTTCKTLHTVNAVINAPVLMNAHPPDAATITQHTKLPFKRPPPPPSDVRQTQDQSLKVEGQLKLPHIRYTLIYAGREYTVFIPDSTLSYVNP